MGDDQPSGVGASLVGGNGRTRAFEEDRLNPDDV